jgi:tetratricopeptide (TPR) repeat protein
MKILSSPWTKATLVAIGLLAVLLAYRPGDSRSRREVTFQSDASTNRTIKVRSPRELAAGSPTNGYAETRFSDYIGEVEADDVGQTQPTEVALPIESEKPERVDYPELDLMPVSSKQASVEQTQSEETRIETDFSGTEEAKPVDFVVSASNTTPMPATPPALHDAAALKAVHHIEYGKSLARRNASEAAAQEFLGALRVLAEANDQATNGNAYISALRAGLQSIKEAADFKTDDPNNQIVMKVSNVIEGHETQIISSAEARTIGPSVAMRRYFEYAGQQLGRCGGQNPVAAEALYCLGKMKTITAQLDPDPESTELNEAIIFHHASLTADRTNHRSANELGVLLARNGHLDAAETYLKNSLKINPTPQSWANLAKVHQRKGTPQDQQLANLAMQEYQISLSQPIVATTQAPIQWVEPQEFMARSPVQNPNETQTIQVPSEVVPVVAEQPEGDNPSIVDRIGSLITPGKLQR